MNFYELSENPASGRKSTALSGLDFGAHPGETPSVVGLCIKSRFKFLKLIKHSIFVRQQAVHPALSEVHAPV